jgi:IPT/TIG domain/Right handed beta helix region/S-layer homology domain
MTKRLAPLAILALASTLSATTFTVTNTADSGPGSLRQALLDAQNCTGAPHTIAFDVPAGSLTNGVAVIAPASLLPPLTCDGTIVDGTTQTTNGGNTNDVILGSGGTVGTGPDGVTGTGDEPALPQLNGPEVEIDGSALTDWILRIDADLVTIRGLSVHGGGFFGGLGLNSGNIDIVSGHGSTIVGNVLGAKATSYANPGGPAQTQNNLIRMTGGDDITIENNLLGFTLWRSIVMFAPVANVTIQGNEFVGSFDGIDFSSPGLGPAGIVAVTRNLFHDFVDNTSGSTIFGIFHTQTGGEAIVTDNTFERVDYGVLSDPRFPLLLENNVMTGGILGVRITMPGTAPAPATITQNSIFGNSGLGIDLLGEGVTANDVGDGDTGPNGLQNFPIIKSVEHLGPQGTGSTRILGNFHGAASTSFDLEFFANPACSNFPREFLEGQTYLGQTEVTTDVSGNAAIDLTLPVETEAGVRISATATDPAGNTSEFSQRIIFSISPVSGPAAGGTPLTASGTDFADPTTMTIGGVAVPVTFVNPQSLTATSPALGAGTFNDVVVQTPANIGVLVNGWVADFLDVPGAHQFYSFVTTLVSNTITVGVGGGSYGVDQGTKRQQMAVFLLKAKHGLCYVPPQCAGAFTDVPCPSLFADWIEALADEGITTGCGGTNFCPNNFVTRRQMAVFLLKGKYGAAYVPPACAGVFDDVPCPGAPAVDFIEQLAAEQITGGCSVSPPLYCPDSTSTRGQMAVFITKTFQLQ